jgi:uroporphyrinogen decarboxylase
MTHLELFRATVEHQSHEGFLFEASYTKDLERRVLEHFGADTTEEVHRRFGMPIGRSVSLRSNPDWEQTDFARYYETLEIPDGAKIDGNGVLHVPGSSYHFTHRISPLRDAVSLAQIEDFPYPSPDRFIFDEATLATEVDAAHEEGKAVRAFCGHIYENAWQIRGYEEFLVDLYQRPENCQHILETIGKLSMALAEAYARAGVDVLHTADDVANQNAMMFAPDLWRKYMKPVWARIIARARQIHPRIEVFYHSDGNIMEIIPDLIEIGISILNPVQPECLDVVEVKKLYGMDLVFHGTIGTQTTMPFGSPDDVRQVVRERKKTAGSDGALILAPTHVLEPEVPIENIIAYLDEC